MDPYERAVAAWLQHNCPNFPFSCMACGKDKWMIKKIVAAPYPPLPASRIEPFIPLFCLNCGYAVFFSADKIFPGGNVP
jgi:predicted nucleic-acid-binding Zn-ribbon protein